jgi:ABC-type uncharacterized transport system permease subunit
MAITLNGSAGVTTNSGAVYNSIQGDTVKTATGTSVDFTSIPSWVKRVTVMFSGVSTNGTSIPLVQLGDSGGIETTGYLGTSTIFRDATAVAGANYTTGFGIGILSAAYVMHGSMVLSLIDSSTNTWASSSNFANSNTAVMTVGAGSKPLSATLDRIRITMVNGTDTFDAGSINILYE